MYSDELALVVLATGAEMLGLFTWVNMLLWEVAKKPGSKKTRQRKNGKRIVIIILGIWFR